MRLSKPWRRGTRYYCTDLDSRRQISLRTDDLEKAYVELARLKEGGPRQAAKPRIVRLHSLRATYLEWVQRNKAARTHEWYEYNLRTVPDWVVSEIRPDAVLEWRLGDKRPGSDEYCLGVNSQSNRLTALIACLRWGVRNGRIASNPIEGIKKENPDLPGYQPRDSQPLSVDDRRRLLDACLNPTGQARRREDLFDLLSVIFLTGCRPFELRITEAKHVKNGVIMLPVAQAKKKRKVRRIVLRSEALEIVKRLCAKHPTGPIFRRENGKPWTSRDVSRDVRAVADRIGLAASAYDLRHQYITDACTSGKASTAAIAELCGTSISMIEAVYYHPSDDQLAALSEAMGY